MQVSGGAYSVFTIHQPYSDTRGVLRRKGVMERITAMSNGEVVGHEWIEKDFELKKLGLKRGRTKYEWRGLGRVRIRSNDPEVQNEILIFKQEVLFTESFCETRLTLMYPVKNLHAYETFTRFEDRNGKTLVSVETKITTSRKAPESYRDYIRHRVEESALNAVKDSEKAIRKVVTVRN